MPIEQTAANTIAKYQSRTVSATFTKPTTPGNLVVVVCSAAGTLPSDLSSPGPGFTQIRNAGLRDIQLAAWYREGSPAISSVSVTALDDNKSMILRAMELSGVAQSNALDKVVIQGREDNRPITGSTGSTAQADEVILGFVCNQYPSTTQFGFTGGLTRISETVSPQSSSRGYNEDWERSRLTVHQATTNAVADFQLSGQLSSSRRWVALLLTFRGQSTGPARFTSTTAPNVLTHGGTGTLTVFGPLRSIDASQPKMLLTGGVRARVGPFNWQYRLGGWDGLLIGDDTPYEVETVDGLEGWDLRTSDDELPRGDGALRGIDLQAARQALFEIKVGGTQREVSQLMDTLYRALVPQRDTDWELIWRHPGRPLRMLRCRPTNLIRGLSVAETVVNHQKFALIAADPRHYSAGIHTVSIPATTATTNAAIIPTSLLNEGNGTAYPSIRIDGPETGPPLTRVELQNVTRDVNFSVEAILPRGSTLFGDMDARATGAPRSVVTIDGQSKYGAWTHPRQTFRLGPGENMVYLRTVPAGAPVRAVLQYRDTWSG